MAQRPTKIGVEVFGELWNMILVENGEWSEKVTNEQVFERIGEKRTFLNILHRKVN